MLEVGWHYTPFTNWRSIKDYGLRPYPMIRHADVLAQNGFYDVRGVWLWTTRQRGRDHFGSIVQRMAEHSCEQVALIEVGYERADLLQTPSGGLVKIYHDGHLSEFKFHDNTPAVIAVKPIPVGRVKLLKVYNLPLLVDVFDEVVTSDG